MGPAAEVAAYYGLPFAVLRVVLDPAHRTIPPSALAGAREDGETDPLAVVRALMKRPGDLPGLLRLAEDTRRASRALTPQPSGAGPLPRLLPASAGELALSVE